MPSGFERGLQIMELLAGRGSGLPLHEIADGLDMPRSAAHRLLSELIEAGFVHQKGDLGNYALGLKIASLGLKHLAANDLASVAKPILDELAEISHELVRLAVIDVDGNNMIWAFKAQGAQSGLRYDPESGATVALSCSATGLAWLSFLPEEEAFARALRQGIGSKEEHGPNAPQTVGEIGALMKQTRERGYAIGIDIFTVGVGSVAAPVYDGDSVAAALSIAGPTARLTEERFAELSVPLLEAASRLSVLFTQSAGSLTTT
jgi:IclR family acetate operon transcriptional repressor